jgi:peptidoglycan hydrolase CwlO-like protein
MTLQDQYLDTARRAQSAWSDATSWWTRSFQDVAGQSRRPLDLVDPTVVIRQWVEFAQDVQQVNMEYVANLIRAASVAGEAVGQHVDGLASAVERQVDGLSDQVQEQVGKVKEAAQEQVKKVEQVEQDLIRKAEQEEAEQEEAEKERVRQARAAERQQAREARQAVRQRYEGKTKAELAEELSKRDLPKTGTVDELIERLVEAETQQ